MSAASITVRTYVTLRGADYTVTGRVSFATRPFFDRSLGVILPGDDAEVEVLSLSPEDDAAPISVDDLTREEEGRCEDWLLDAAHEQSEADAYRAEEMRGEMARERRSWRDDE
jgi:hypothetical protein